MNNKKRIQSAHPGQKPSLGYNFKNTIITNNINKNIEVNSNIRPISNIEIYNYKEKPDKTKIVLDKKTKIYVEKEKLESDAFKIFDELKKVKQENKEAKKRLKEIEKENKEIENFLKEHSYIWDDKNSDEKESNLLKNLKNKLISLKKEYENKEIEVHNLKKEYKYTKMNELNIEIEELNMENKRLSIILKNNVKKDNNIKTNKNNKNYLNGNKTRIIKEKYIKQAKIIEFLRKEKNDLEININITSIQTEESAKKLQEIKDELKYYEEKEKKLKEEVLLEQRKVKALQKEAESFKKSYKEQKLFDEYSKKKIDKKDLINNLRLKQEEIKELEKEYIKLQNEFISKIEKDNKQKNELKKQLDELNGNNDEITNMFNTNNNKNDIYYINKKKEFSNYVLIKQIFEEIKINLIKNRIEINEIDELLVSVFNFEEIDEFKFIEALTKYPFELDEIKATSVYEYIILEANRTDIKIDAQQLFYVFIGEYYIETEEKILQNFDNLKEKYFNENNISHLKEIYFIKYEEIETINFIQLKELLFECQIYLNEEEITTLFSVISEDKGLDNINIKRFFQLIKN